MKMAAPNTDIENLLSDLPVRKPFKEEVAFHTVAILCRMYGLFKKIVRILKRMMVLTFRKPYRMIVPRPKES
jgi:hypothetical protein